MVAPIVGPTRETQDYQVYYRRADRYKQTKPYNLVLPYELVSGKTTIATGNLATNPNYRPAGTMESLYNGALNSSQVNQARINAYEKFKAACGDRAQMGENLASLSKSMTTIEQRAIQLFRFTMAVKKGRLADAAAILQTPQPKRKHPVKEQANNWLEYHLGIEPCVNDIYSAIDVLQQPIKAMRVKARGFTGPFSLGSWRTPNPWSANWDRGCSGISIEYGAEIAVSNPNLYLANALGVINPVQVLWQLAPLSFVLDWLANVEQFLGTSTDMFGLTIQKSRTTMRCGLTYQEFWNTYGWVIGYVGLGTNRVVGLTYPMLGLRPYKQLSWQRGLTAISLLIPQLKSLSLTGYDSAARDKASYRRRVNDSRNIKFVRPL